jgi:CBS domain-containing protein
MICPTCNTNNLPGSEVCSHCLTDLSQLDRPVAHDRVERSLMEDSVMVLRPLPPVSLPVSATIGEALHRMLACDIGALVILDVGKLVGILTERDLLTKVAGLEGDYALQPIRPFMTPNPETIQSTDTLAFALRKMDCGGYRHLPVMRDGQAVGMISVRDMLRHMTRLCRKEKS